MCNFRNHFSIEKHGKELVDGLFGVVRCWLLAVMMRCYDKIVSVTDLLRICLTKKKNGAGKGGAQNMDAASAKLAQSFREASALAARIFEYFFVGILFGALCRSRWRDSNNCFRPVIVFVRRCRGRRGRKNSKK